MTPASSPAPRPGGSGQSIHWPVQGCQSASKSFQFVKRPISACGQRKRVDHIPTGPPSTARKEFDRIAKGAIISLPPRTGRGNWNWRESLLTRPDSCPANGVHLSPRALMISIGLFDIALRSTLRWASRSQRRRTSPGQSKAGFTWIGHLPPSSGYRRLRLGYEVREPHSGPERSRRQRNSRAPKHVLPSLLWHSDPGSRGPGR
jgi:hypothetical protein